MLMVEDVEIVDDNFLLDVPYALDRPKQSEPTFTSFRPESKGNCFELFSLFCPSFI